MGGDDDPVGPAAVVVVPDVPKTRSGKIMRRLLTQMFEGTPLGDTTSLQNEEAMAGIIAAVTEYNTKDHS
jgi:acetyl-CoA synthetase